MPFDPQEAIRDIESVLAHKTETNGLGWVTEMSALYLSCIDRWCPPHHSLSKQAHKIDMFPDKSIAKPEQHMRAVLSALLADYRAGRVRTFAEMMRLFSRTCSVSPVFCSNLATSCLRP
jgi:hypothetical protein